MRIVYHHRTRATDAQGIHIAEIVNAFRGLGHTVEVVSLVKPGSSAPAGSHSKNPKQARFVPFLNEIVQLGYNLLGVPMLLRRLLSSPADFIYERYSLFNFAGVFVARLTGTPIILEVNSPLAWEQHREGAIRLFALARWTERVICNLATRVIVVSTPLKEMMEANGVKPSKLVVMPNGVDPDLFQTGEDVSGYRRKLNLEGKVVFGFAGWFKKWHGVELLLEAFRQPSLAETGAVLLLIGDGPAMPDLRAYTAAHGLGDHVVFTGPVPHNEVSKYLSLADIAVQPAANEYCCPMKILEYMALAKPIVAPRQANILDLLREDEAYLFEPGSVHELALALADLARDVQRREYLGQLAHRAIREREYLWKRNAARVVAMAASAANLRPGHAPHTPMPIDEA